MAKPTFQDYVDAGVLIPKPVAPSWLVRTASGNQFSTHVSEETAQKWAEKIGGTVEWYVPIQSEAYKTIGTTYDH
ncbi:hypothetical protein SEA_FRANKLIN22_58 [Microbacterium phage Franklin22]|uniref:hypothetical protein n=1 Tax=Microbacterium phage Franklin22 TaxID=2894293 RepID=UPI001E705510|nr:hypothetical protein QDW15_gp58 [Microbacterium phage Franklin22]UGL61871.1 hypothetical protein SEA_FRANKLIN22_58 [Microbacterium phage Franklin22]